MRSILSPFVPLVTVSLLGGIALADEPAPTPAPPAAPAPAPKSTPVVSVPTFENATCPIMGRPSSRILFTDTAKGRIYVCCPPCVAKIKADPDRAYSTAYPTTRKVGNTVCPVTGQKIGDDAAVVLLQGYEISVANKDAVGKAQANAQIVLTKVLKPDVVDIGNLTSPISGKPVADNVFVLIDRDLVRLAAASEIEDVRRDPDKARKAAKDIAAKQAAEKAKEGTPQPPAR
jgi:hypothetical protein